VTGGRDSVETLLEALSVFPGSASHGDTIRELQEAATALRNDRRFFAAGFGLSRGIHLAWGDVDAMDALAEQAAADLRRAVEESTDPMDAIAALQTWISMLWGAGTGDPTAQRSTDLALDQVLADRLRELASGAGDPREVNSYLVYGLHLSTDFRSGWTVEFLDREARRGVLLYNRQRITLAIPGAFEILVRGGDYQAAGEIVEAHREAFTSHGLRGWRAAVQGFTEPGHEVERFAESAEHFAQDTEPDPVPPEGWSSVNIHLWAPYFDARSEVAQIIRSPSDAAEHIHRARELLAGTNSGWVNPQVTCFRVVLDVLDGLFAETHEEIAEETRKELMLAVRLSGVDESNGQALTFLDDVAAAYDELRGDPASSLTSGKLSRALAALGRIPLFGPDVASAVQPFVRARAWSAIEGQQLTWIHKTLESIRDERVLQKVLLRLFQSSVPRFAQVRHGPLEFGKDIAVLAESDGELVLTLWQVKAGDIDKPKWRDAAQELEEMFQVPLSEAQLPDEPFRVRGLLVFNGHVSPYVEPAVNGWLEEQRRDHGREVELIHLDELVYWIVQERLITELRAALSEFAVAIVR
jgi:hypothetical protein